MVLDEKQLLALEDQARLDLEAIQRIRGMMARQNGVTPAARVPPPPPVAPAVVAGRTQDEMADFQDYDDTPGGDQATSLIGTISKTINADPGVRWTTAKVLAHLQSTNYPLKATKPLYSIGQALGKLVERGHVRILRRGVGSKPNIYAAGVQSELIQGN